MKKLIQERIYYYLKYKISIEFNNYHWNAGKIYFKSSKDSEELKMSSSLWTNTTFHFPSKTSTI